MLSRCALRSSRCPYMHVRAAWANKRGIVVNVEVELSRRLKHLAADRDTTLQALGVEAFECLITGR